jgi:hypothetical protein
MKNPTVYEPQLPATPYKREFAGWMVVEASEDFEQALGLSTGPGMPVEGVLDWTDGEKAIFLSTKEAKAAIKRTELYRLALDTHQLPERKYCKVIRVEFVRKGAS